MAFPRSTLKQVGRDELMNWVYLGGVAECSLLLVCLSEVRTVRLWSDGGLVSAARWLERKLDH